MSNQHAELSRRWFEEVWNQRRSATIDELLTPDSVGHLESGDVVGIDAFKRVHADFLTAFPDLRIQVEAVVADGDDVVIRWRASGTHTGDGLGVKATGRPVSFSGITWHRYRSGKLSEGWNYWSHLALVEQLRGVERSRQEAGSSPVR